VGGAVVAWFPRAWYVSVPGGLVSLVAPGVLAGPTHVVVDEALPAVAPGTPARAGAGRLEIGPHSIDLTRAREWRGALPLAPAVLAAAGRILQAIGPSGRSALHEEPYRSRGALARARIDDGDLAEAARLLVGLGPGLTPSGDDALAGVLFAVRAALGPDAEGVTVGLAELGETGEISRAFLRWAARGQCLAPAHELLASAAAGDAAGAARAAGTMATVGETSGADFLLGLGWGIEAAISGSRRRSPTAVDTRRREPAPSPPT
jgi:hypothetical protein